jgi:uncharacterized OB-fold protein
MLRCDCGFEFETRPGHFRNFNMKFFENDIWIMICPKCGKEYKPEHRY